MKTIKGKVVSYSDIPKELIIGTRNHWLSEFKNIPDKCLVEVHIDEMEAESLSNWLMKTYPGIEEDTFYIEIDC